MIFSLVDFLNVNCRYLVILFNEIKVLAGIEACFATVKYSIYCLKTPKKRQMTFKKLTLDVKKSNGSNETPNVMTVGVENYGLKGYCMVYSYIL
jgi:hypothetical protein